MMLKRLTHRLLLSSLLGLGSVGFAISFVMEKDEDPRPAEAKSEAKSDQKSESKDANPKEGEKSEKKPEKSASSKGKQGACLTSEAAVEDLRSAREEIQKREKALSIREGDIQTRENSIADQLKRLDHDRQAIQKTQQEQSKETEEKKAKLIETFLAMSPKTAAKILSSLDNSLAVSVMYQMDTLRLAKIMNLVEAKRATELSELLVGLSRTKSAPDSKMERSVSSDAAEGKEKMKKGGEK
jgi:hypothetical protein